MGKINSSKKDIFRILLSIAVSGIIFFGFSFIYLKLCRKAGVLKINEADNKKNDIPYSENLPDNMAVNLIFSDESKYSLFFDFKSKEILINQSQKQAKKYIKLNSESSAEIIDNVGGIEIFYQGKKIRCTGVQAINLLSKNSVTKDDIIKAFFESTTKENLTKEKISDILNSGDTDISAYDTYFWQDYISEMLKNVKFNN